MNEPDLALNRRRFLECFSASGLTLMPGALLAVAQDARRITPEMFAAAARIAGVSFSPEEQQAILTRLNGPGGPLPGFDALHGADLSDTQPAFVFNPLLPGKPVARERRPLVRQAITVARPATDEDLAFQPVTHLARLLESRQVTSTELMKLYLSRLKKYDPQLQCVVNLTEDLALRQARQADEEIAAGKYRGPLHGVPYGLKDLFAVRGTKTTWGMTPYRDRGIDQGFNRVRAADRRRRSPRGKALHRRAGGERALVRGPHPLPVGHHAGRGRIVRRTRRGDRGRTGRFCDRHRHRRLGRPAVEPKRNHRPPPDLRSRQPRWRHGPGMDAGYGRPDVPLRRRLRPRLARDSRPGRTGQLGTGHPVQLGRHHRA